MNRHRIKPLTLSLPEFSAPTPPHSKPLREAPMNKSINAENFKEKLMKRNSGVST